MKLRKRSDRNTISLSARLHSFHPDSPTVLSFCPLISFHAIPPCHPTSHLPIRHQPSHLKAFIHSLLSSWVSSVKSSAHLHPHHRLKQDVAGLFIQNSSTPGDLSSSASYARLSLPDRTTTLIYSPPSKHQRLSWTMIHAQQMLLRFQLPLFLFLVFPEI